MFYTESVKRYDGIITAKDIEIKQLRDMIQYKEQHPYRNVIGDIKRKMHGA
jgi:hypothetical protein